MEDYIAELETKVSKFERLLAEILDQGRWYQSDADYVVEPDYPGQYKDWYESAGLNEVNHDF